jgi:festuclavine dehydrogenase
MLENFSQHENHLKSIKEENKIYSATGAGRIPWVACSDIAAVGFHALTTPEAPNREYVVLGDVLYDYADVSRHHGTFLPSSFSSSS